MQRHPGRWAATIVFVGTALGGYIKGNEWWQAHKPKTRQLVEVREASITYLTPNIAKVVEGIAIPDGLTLKFSTAAARLDQVKAPNPAGITLTPSHPGRWVWETDKLLAFKPSADWPPGADFTVTLDPSQLAKEVKLKDKPNYTFHIFSLNPKWSNLEFYTNPKAPEEHEITATLSFTHPMALGEVEKHINLRTIGGSNVFKAGANHLAAVIQVFRSNEAHNGINQEWMVAFRKGVATRFHDELVRAVIAVGTKFRPLARFKVHEIRTR